MNIYFILIYKYINKIILLIRFYYEFHKNYNSRDFF